MSFWSAMSNELPFIGLETFFLCVLFKSLDVEALLPLWLLVLLLLSDGDMLPPEQHSAGIWMIVF